MHSLEHIVLGADETLPSASLVRHRKPGTSTSLMVTKDLVYGLRGAAVSIINIIDLISTLLDERVRCSHHILIERIRLLGHSAISKFSRHGPTFIFHCEHLDLV